MRTFALLLLPLLAACAAAGPRDSLDAGHARDYVVLQLAIGEKEAGYIDAYYGPEELKARAGERPGGDAAQSPKDRRAPGAGFRRLRASSPPEIAQRRALPRRPS